MEGAQPSEMLIYNYHTSIHGATTQKTTYSIFTAMKTSNLASDCVVCILFPFTDNENQEFVFNYVMSLSTFHMFFRPTFSMPVFNNDEWQINFFIPKKCNFWSSCILFFVKSLQFPWASCD
jgi:hypothetical protein